MPAARESDLILIEGVMGLYDGAPSGADIARRFGIPVMAVIDARAMAQTFGAVAYGLAHYQPGLPFAGVLANHVGSARHADMLRESLPAGMRWFGAVMRDADAGTARAPPRPLAGGGDRGSRRAARPPRRSSGAHRCGGAAACGGVSGRGGAGRFRRCSPARRIAIARDAAYGFLYPANVDTLRALGAELAFFSPLAGEALPAQCDAVWLPGGYPELHGAALAANAGLWTDLRAHVAAGKPVLAECGGLMSLLEAIVDKAGVEHAFAGLLPGRAVMQKRLAALGMQEVDLPGGRVTGHTFHYSRTETPLAPWLQARRPDGGEGEAIYRRGPITALLRPFLVPVESGGGGGLVRRLSASVRGGDRCEAISRGRFRALPALLQKASRSEGPWGRERHPGPKARRSGASRERGGRASLRGRKTGAAFAPAGGPTRWVPATPGLCQRRPRSHPPAWPSPATAPASGASTAPPPRARAPG